MSDKHHITEKKYRGTKNVLTITREIKEITNGKELFKMKTGKLLAQAHYENENWKIKGVGRLVWN